MIFLTGEAISRSIQVMLNQNYCMSGAVELPGGI